MMTRIVWALIAGLMLTAGAARAEEAQVFDLGKELAGAGLGRRAVSSVSTGVALNGWGFYSPGIQCPSGYATSCVATEGVVGGFNFQFGLLPSETAIGCCPT